MLERRRRRWSWAQCPDGDASHGRVFVSPSWGKELHTQNFTHSLGKPPSSSMKETRHASRRWNKQTLKQTKNLKRTRKQTLEQTLHWNKRRKQTNACFSVCLFHRLLACLFSSFVSVSVVPAVSQTPPHRHTFPAVSPRCLFSSTFFQRRLVF